MKVIRKVIGNVYYGPCTYCSSIPELTPVEVATMQKIGNDLKCPVCGCNLWIVELELEKRTLYES